MLVVTAALVVLVATAWTGVGAQSLGAVYVHTNDPAGNKVVISTVSAGGALAYSSSVSTGGNGVGGSVGADALFSQDSVTVGDNFLFVVNAGSSTLSTFAISNGGLTLTLLNTAPTRGTFPVSVAYSSALKAACVLNGGSNNGVTCFNVSSTSGATFASTVALSVSGLLDVPTGPAGTFGDINFDTNGAQVLVAFKGLPGTAGTVYAIPLQSGLQLGTPVANSISGSQLLFTLTNIGQTSTWLYADPAFGYGTVTVSGSTVTGASTVAIRGQNASCWSAYSPRSGKAYVIDANGTVNVVSVTTSTTPAPAQWVVTGVTVATGLLDATLAVFGSQEYMFVVAQKLPGLLALTLDTSGSPTLLQGLNMTGYATPRLQGVAAYVTPTTTTATGSTTGTSNVMSTTLRTSSTSATGPAGVTVWLVFAMARALLT